MEFQQFGSLERTKGQPRAVLREIQSQRRGQANFGDSDGPKLTLFRGAGIGFCGTS